ncbi:MAG: phytanoyl-CoA dioxygenase family protein [Planctomycetes bacterium]|nr:phytanoyl-CoA dioxygenase family protein [Planctomycetota bacterium]
MNLSEQTYRHYWDKGWAVIEGVFLRQETDPIAAVALSLSKEELRGNPQPGARVDRSLDGKEMAPRKLDSPFLKDPAFRSFVLDVRLVGLIRSFLGENPVLLTDQILMKPPRYGSQKPYHQDNAYFRKIF